MRKRFLITILCFVALAMISCNSDYVDLGLSSGTLWKSTNEDGFYDFDAARESFGDNMPTQSELMELVNECDWIWSGMGYRIVGPNGNSITLPASGLHYCEGEVSEVGKGGFYWSSTLDDDSQYGRFLYFYSDKIRIDGYDRCHQLSVRLVK